MGFNWYLNRFTKLATVYEHTTFSMAVPAMHHDNVLASRLQPAF